MKTLGKIDSIPIREVWTHEANEFTPWLAKVENILQLAEALGLGELEIEAIEKDLGRFSADIVARDEGGTQILIENQLEQTDHRHLGQVLTYLAGLDGDATVIWIATHFLEEHRAAIDWLNANTNERFDFFGVEIEVLRIGSSEPAPRFNVIAKPNGWTRSVGLASLRIRETPFTETQVLYEKYWIALRDQYRHSGLTERFPKPWPRQWLPFSIGRSGFRLNCVLFRDQRRIRVELYLSQRDDPQKRAFQQLLAQKTEIELEIGVQLDWQELPGKRASRIAYDLDNADIQNLPDGPRQQQWLLEYIQKFRTVFAKRIKRLRLENERTAEVSELDAQESENASY